MPTSYSILLVVTTIPTNSHNAYIIQYLTGSYYCVPTNSHNAYIIQYLTSSSYNYTY